MRPITIIGGGLAGLTLGVGLRRREVPVTIIEAGHYPRHRVCGEFISGHGRAILRELDLEDEILNAGAREARTAAFFTPRTEGRPQTLPRPALCVSRFVLDDLIAARFRGLGGVLRDGERWRNGFGDGVVRGTGRRIQSTVRGWRWLGLKVHTRRLEMAADLEMHMGPSGYVGLCQLGGGEANVCGLFRVQSSEPDLARNWRRWLAGPEDSILRRRLEAAEFLPSSFCSVAGLMLEPQSASTHGECCIGDALTMIAPLTGNGMSMAFESASIAMAPLEAYSRGALAWNEASRQIAKQCDATFHRRLRLSQCLQKAAFATRFSDALVWIANRSPTLWKWFFERTR